VNKWDGVGERGEAQRCLWGSACSLPWRLILPCKTDVHKMDGSRGYVRIEMVHRIACRRSASSVQQPWVWHILESHGQWRRDSLSRQRHRMLIYYRVHLCAGKGGRFAIFTTRGKMAPDGQWFRPKGRNQPIPPKCELNDPKTEKLGL
jgi:hypothetical protein